MTREDAAIVASRSLALLMAVWTLVELTELPVRIFSLLHHLGQQSVLVHAATGALIIPSKSLSM